MCIGYMRILQHLYKGFEHPWVWVSWGVLEPISHRNGETTTFSMASDSIPLLPHAPPAAPPWPTLFLLFGCPSHHFVCLVSTCSGVGTQLIFPSPGNLPRAPRFVQASPLRIPRPRAVCYLYQCREDTRFALSVSPIRLRAPPGQHAGTQQ